MQQQALIRSLRNQLSDVIIGQEQLLDRLVVVMLAHGHILVEGAPGLAKTTVIKVLTAAMECSFHRIQFTPDLLPGDVTGTDIYNPADGSFRFVEGPIFSQVILADEINRAPAKVQSALLEAMQERQVTVGGVSRPLQEPFLVMATQNPLEQSGTYPLPEAQMDRFLLQVVVDYPDPDQELAILRADRAGHLKSPGEGLKKICTAEDLLLAQQEVEQVHMDESIEKYIVQLVTATRHVERYLPEFAQSIQHGASPRATLALARCASALAYLNDRDYVVPGDIKELAADCLRHRIIMSVNARMEDIQADTVIEALLGVVPIAQ